MDKQKITEREKEQKLTNNKFVFNIYVAATAELSKLKRIEENNNVQLFNGITISSNK